MISTDTRANVIQEGEPAHGGGAGEAPAATALALGWSSAYVAISAAVLAAGGHWGLGAAHLVLLGASWWAGRSKAPVGVAARDLIPLVAMPLLYVELPSLMSVLGTGYHDLSIQGIETMIFGGQPSRTLAARFPWRPLSEVLHAGYLAYYASIFVPALVLFRRGRRRGLSELVLALTVTYTICWVVFVAMPVQGPRYLWPPPDGMPDGPVRRAAAGLLAQGSSRGAAFPSSHMAVATVVALMCIRWMRTQAWLWVTVALFVGIGAVYGGFHYAVDVLAGLVLGVTVFVAVVTRSRTISVHDAARE